MRPLWRCLTPAVILVGSICGWAQSSPNPVTVTAAAQNQRGRGSVSSPRARAGGSLTITGSESYSYSVPMFALPGRHGLSLNLSLVYNDLIWQTAGNGVVYSPDTDYNFYAPSPGFHLDLGTLIWFQTQGILGGGVLIDPDGTKHPLISQSGSSTQFVTGDSTYVTVQHHYSTGGGDPPSDIVTHKNGVQVFYQFGLNNSLGSITLMQPFKIEDTSGNFISIAYTGGNQFTAPSISSITDTVGRVIRFFYTTVAGNTVLNCVTDGTSCGAAGSRTFTFNWATNYILNYNFTNVIGYNGWSSTPPSQGSQFPYVVLSGVTRPDATKVQFNYGDWLIVKDIQELSNNGTLRYETKYNFPAASAGALSQPPGYTQQTVTTFDQNGNAKTATWNYQWVLTSTALTPSFVGCVAITDPVGTSRITSFSANGDVFDGLPIQSTVGTGSSTPCTTAPTTTWLTSKTAWISDTNGSGTSTGINPRVQTRTSILSDGTTQSQTQIAGYDTHGNATDIKQFDYGKGTPGALLRETVRSFSTSLGNIFNLPTDIQVKDGGGNVLAHATMTYDNYAQTQLQNQSPLPTGFDSSNFSATSTTPRGNLTGMTVYANAAAGTGGISSTFAYDIFGNLLSSQSGCCSFGSSVYSDTTGYAYPDSASIGPSNNQLTTTFTYNMSDGRVASGTDPNGQQTQFNYDIDNRMQSVTTPDGITTTNSYDDSSETPGVTVSNNANSLVAKSIGDFLGRPLAREILNSTSVVSEVSYVEDSLGRVTQVSNPSGPSDTVEYTTRGYDPLGRVTSITPPALAGTTQNPYQLQYTPTTYTDAAGKTHSGVSIQATDPAGKPRVQYKDALGRVVRVDEPSVTSPGTSATASVNIAGLLGTTEGGSSWTSQDLSAIAGAPTNVLPMAGSTLATLEQGGTGSNYNETYFIGADQHVHMLLNNISAGAWGNHDINSYAGSPTNVLPMAGSALATLNEGGNGSNFTEAYFVGTDQHVHMFLDNISAGAWGNWDINAGAGAPTNVLPVANSALAAINQGSCFTEAYFIGTDQHVHMLLNNYCQSAWGNWDINASAGAPTNVLPATGSALAAINQGSCFTETYFIGTDQHVHMMLNNICAGGWGNHDINSYAGAPTNVLPEAGSALAALYDGSNYTETFFIGTDQHVHMLLNNVSAGGWGNHDVSAYAGAPSASAGTSIAAALLSNGVAVAFVSADSHVHLLLDWANQWSDEDLTARSGAPVAGSGALGLFIDGNTIRVQFTAGSGHIYQLLFAGNGTTVTDSGMVSLDVNGFAVTACYGASSNPACSGQSVNNTAAQVASALGQALNVSGSPVTAVVSGATINVTAREAGPNTTPVPALSSTHDNPNLFTSGSFTSQATSFSGGQGPPLTNPNSTFYSYDALGHLLQVVQGQQTRTYSYDSLGRTTSSSIPETNYASATVTYTDFGAPSQITDPRVIPGTTTNITTKFAYDPLNRVSTVTYNDGTPQVTLTYNAPNSPNNTGGRLAQVTNGVSTEKYQYDVMGRVTLCSKTIAGQTYNITYKYNLDGTLASITYPSGRIVSMGEDAIGRLTQIQNDGKAVLTIGSYNAAGRVLQETYGSGMTGSYTFNNQLQVASLQYGNSTATLLSLVYSYGGTEDNGQIQTITDNVDSGRSTAYSYDALGRLLQAATVGSTNYPKWDLAFSYDRYGNRLSETPQPDSSPNIQLPSNQVSVNGATNQISTSGYSYDAAGDMTSDGLFNYAFDANGQMISVSQPGSSTALATFSYDASGLRVIKNSTTSTVYIYSGRKVIAEYANGAAATSPSTEYIYRGHRLLATITGVTTTYHYGDHLSGRIDTDSSGNVVHTFAHFPYGETWYETGTASKWKFTGYENDSESGLNYAGARFQSPRLGRFMSMDPLSGRLGNPQSLNRYLYVMNDPINATDSTGMEKDDGGGPDCSDTFAGCDDGGGSGSGDGGSGNGNGGDSGGDFVNPSAINNDLSAFLNNTIGASLVVSDVNLYYNGAADSGSTADALDGGNLAIPDTNSTMETISTTNSSDPYDAYFQNMRAMGEEPLRRDGWNLIYGQGNLWGTSAYVGNALGLGTLGGVVAAPFTGAAITSYATAVGWYYAFGGAITTMGAGIAILGRYPSYVEDAEEMGAAAFNPGNGRLWTFLQANGVGWTANEAFMDGITFRNMTIYFSSPSSQATFESGYWQELQYLGNKYGTDPFQFPNPFWTSH